MPAGLPGSPISDSIHTREGDPASSSRWRGRHRPFDADLDGPQGTLARALRIVQFEHRGGEPSHQNGIPWVSGR